MDSLGLFCPLTSHVKGYPFEVALPEAGCVNGVVLAQLIVAASTEVLGMGTSKILPLIVPDNAETL
jgi:mRNA-degrading endonuclease toxin of MazEF toxin-antitoxin module